MAKCAHCKRIVLFGGKTDGELRYCNQKCLDQDVLRETSELIPQDVLDQRVQAVHRGRCPKCRNEGPVDVHQSYSLWTILYVTHTSTQVHLCCRNCARRAQSWATIRSLLLGIWGPFGLVLTPVQILRNVSGMIGGPPPYAPSAPLFQLIRRATAEQIIEHASARSRSPAEDVGEDQRRDDRGIRLDDVLGRVDAQLAPGDLLVGHGA
jgi:hypothetical protein